MRDEVRWERMFPDELDAALDGCPVAYFTYGLCEPHGPQSALGMDALRPHAVACLAARKHGGIVAPPHYWHIHDYGIYSAWAHPIIGSARPWLTPIPPWVFFRNVLYHVRAADALGFHAAVLFTGHLGPHAHDLNVIVDAVQPHVSARVRFTHDGELMPEEYRADLSHAGKAETSYLWAVEPDCVDASRLPATGAPGPHFAMAPNAPDADRRLGEAMVTAMADNLGAMAGAMLDDYARAAPAIPPPTYADIERIWETDIRPKVPELSCMSDLEAERGQQPPPEESPWHRNWRVPEGVLW